MKLCNSHGSDLQTAIRKKGMASLMRPERATEFAEKWLLGVTAQHEFDPYVVAVLEIASKARELNVYVVPGGCALCTLNAAYRKEIAASWVDNITDLMVIVARTNQLKVAA